MTITAPLLHGTLQLYKLTTRLITNSGIKNNNNIIIIIIINISSIIIAVIRIRLIQEMRLRTLMRRASNSIYSRSRSSNTSASFGISKVR